MAKKPKKKAPQATPAPKSTQGVKPMPPVTAPQSPEVTPPSKPNNPAPTAPKEPIVPTSNAPKDEKPPTEAKTDKKTASAPAKSDTPEKTTPTKPPTAAEKSPITTPVPPEADKPEKTNAAQVPSTNTKPSDKSKEENSADSPAKPNIEAATPAIPPNITPTAKVVPQKPEKIVLVERSKIRPFKNHPYKVGDNAEMQALTESVKIHGITQAVTLRPLKDDPDGFEFEMVSGHRRDHAAGNAEIAKIPAVIRDLTDDQAIQQMVEDNQTQRENILVSEKAQALKMQRDAIKRQGARDGTGERADAIVGERNTMSGKQVQRYIKLTELVPELMELVDAKKMGFTTAVELAHIKDKGHQRYIAENINSLGSAPSLAQAQRMREMSDKDTFNPDVIDGIMMEQKKKENDNVILSNKELAEFFPKGTTPAQMREQIMKMLAVTAKNNQKLTQAKLPVGDNR